jgi:hypothetical protein
MVVSAQPTSPAVNGDAVLDDEAVFIRLEDTANLQAPEELHRRGDAVLGGSRPPN